MAGKTDTSGYETLRSRIKNKNLAGTYVFYGEEAYLRERTIEEMRQMAVPHSAESFNLNLFDSSVSPEDLAQAVNSLPMLCEYRVVIVRDVDLYKLQEGLQRSFISILEDVPEYCVLIFVYDALPYKTDARKKIHGVLKKHALTVEFALNDAARLVPWIKRHFKSEGLEIGTQDAQYLIFMVGRQMTGLLGEIGKLSAYSTGGVITKDDIDKVVVPGIEAETFSLVRYICRGEHGKAFELLGQLFEQHTDAAAILGAIGWQLRRIYTACLVRRDGGGIQKFMQVCPGMYSSSAKMTMQLASAVSVDWCRSALKACTETDLDSKTGGGGNEELFELLVLKLIQEKVAHAED